LNACIRGCGGGRPGHRSAGQPAGRGSNGVAAAIHPSWLPVAPSPLLAQTGVQFGVVMHRVATGSVYLSPRLSPSGICRRISALFEHWEAQPHGSVWHGERVWISVRKGAFCGHTFVIR
ncbi:unnamed protein product, partial [Phaeothamnion confervicola]